MTLTLLLKKLLAAITALSALLSGLQHQQQAKPHILTTQGAIQLGLIDKNHIRFGAAGAVDQVAAFFETYLQTGITSSATSFTLNSASTTAGTALPNGTYGFVLDQGTTQQEVVRGTLSGTSVTNVTRGVDPSNYNATTSVLMYPHSRGADIKITDYPIIGQISRLLNGSDTLPSTLSYTLHPLCASSASTTLVDWYCVSQVATSGAPDAGLSSKGLVAIGTPTSPATSTDGSSILYNLPSFQYYATSSAGTSSVVMTNGSGFIDYSFISSSTALTRAATTTFASTTIFQATTTINGLLDIEGSVSGTFARKIFIASGTFNVPSGVSTIYVTLLGGGGGGGNGTGSLNGGGGASGSLLNRLSTSTSLGGSFNVTIGAPGLGGIQAGATSTAGGNTTIGTILAPGGGPGGTGNSGTGGMASTTSGVGVNGISGSASVAGAGAGGFMGFGGTTAVNTTGTNATGYGGGGGGGGEGGPGQAGGNGTQGFAIIEW